MTAAGPYQIAGEHFGSMNDRTTRVSIELRYLRLRNGRLLTWSEVLPSREATLELKRAARFLGCWTLESALAKGWLPDLQSLAIAFIEGPS